MASFWTASRKRPDNSDVETVAKAPRTFWTRYDGKLLIRPRNDFRPTLSRMVGMPSNMSKLCGFWGPSWKKSTMALVPSAPPLRVVISPDLASLLSYAKRSVALSILGTAADA